MIKKALLTGILVAIIGAGPSGCYSHSNQSKQVLPDAAKYGLDKTVEGIEFTSADWPQPLHADLYLPDKPGPHAVVLMVHGGGWANRSRHDMTGISRKLARYGYAVFNINYRFSPRYTYPAQLQDLNQALRWIVDYAVDYDLDIQRINAWGYSSGAHLAALVGGFNQSPVNLDLARINAVVAGGIPADLRKYSGSPIVMRFMGGDRHEMPERYAEASPAYHISADDPPVFLYHGKLDFLVSVDQAIDYYEALLAAGVEAELYLHGWREHATMFLFGGDAENRAIDFLNRHNAVTGLLAAEQK